MCYSLVTASISLLLTCEFATWAANAVIHFFFFMCPRALSNRNFFFPFPRANKITMDQIPLLSPNPLEKSYLGNPGFVASYLPNTLKRMILSIRDTWIFCVPWHISIFQKLVFNETWEFVILRIVFFTLLYTPTYKNRNTHRVSLLYLKRHPSQ